MMITQGLLGLALAAGAAAPPAQAPSPPPAAAQTPDPHTPSDFDRGGPDSREAYVSQAKEDDARRYFADFSRCIASNNKRQAAALLAMSYASAEQSKRAYGIVAPNDGCWGPMISSMRIAFSAPTLAGGMAEYFILHPKEIDALRTRYPASFAWPARNGMEAFGACVVDQSEAGVRALIDTKVTSDEEAAATQALAPALGQCVTEGQTITLNIGSLRQMLAVALYRQMAAPPVATPVVPVATPAAAANR